MISNAEFSLNKYGSEYCKDDERHYFLDNHKAIETKKDRTTAYET